MAAGGHYALIVGVECYGHHAPPIPDWNPSDWDLHGPYADAAWFARWLVLQEGVLPKNIRVFANRAPRDESLPSVKEPVFPKGVVPQTPTHSAIREAVTFDLVTLNPSFLWVFWSGHGIMRSGQDTRLVLTADAHPEDKRNFDLAALLAYLRSDAFPNLSRTVCLIDACANTVDSKVPGNDLPPRLEIQGRRQQTLFACAPTSKAKTDPEKDEGFFTRELRVILPEKPAPDRVWPPDMDAVCDRLRERFEKLVQEGVVASKPTFWQRYGDGSLRTLENGPLIRPFELPAGVPLQHADMAKLDVVLTGMVVDDAVVDGLYREFCHFLAPRPEGRTSRLSAAAWRLAELFPLPGGALPVLGFLASVRPQMEPKRGADFDAWWNGLDGRPGVNLAASQLLARAKQVPTAAVLLVKLKPVPSPDASENTRYHVTAWLWPDGYPGSHVPLDGTDAEKPAACSGLNALLAGLVEAAYLELAEGVPLRVEFLAPMELFGEKFEDIPVLDGAMEVRLGHLTPVVVRAYERAYVTSYRHARDRRQKKWTRAQAQFEVAQLAWAPAGAPDDAFFATLCDDAPLALFAAQLPGDRNAARELIKQLYSSGLPLAAILREPIGGAVDPQKQLPAEFLGKPPELWPSAALDARKTSRLQHLTVLWDNPAHPPPDEPSPANARSRRASAPT